VVVEAEPVAVGADADGRRDDAPERQWSLSSWAAFMAGEHEEPPRTRRDGAPTLSLFE